MSAASQIRHPSPRDLALIALGDETPKPTERHLRDCQACRSVLDSFLRVLEAGRAAATEPVQPPAHVWETIRRHL
jgi:hypothetical protein